MRVRLHFADRVEVVRDVLSIDVSQWDVEDPVPLEGASTSTWPGTGQAPKPDIEDPAVKPSDISGDDPS